MNLIQVIKDEKQDFEWYPTTDKMLNIVARDINESTLKAPHNLRDNLTGIMDIGAGDGRALVYFNEHCSFNKFMAIEKSSLLAKQWPDYVFPVGCDMKTQTFIDKPAEVIFCNPPYSEYAEWMAKVVNEGYFITAYFIVPVRWKDDRLITDALEKREMKAETIWTGDFLNAERSARAKIDIVKIIPLGESFHGERFISERKVDPFTSWFDTQFSFNESPKFEEQKIPLRNRALVSGKNLIEALEQLYHDELGRLHNSYKAITALEMQTLKDLGIEKETIRTALREKIKGLKNKYWEEVFNSLDKVTTRLTEKSRRSLLEKLMSAVTVDFDANNVYTVLIWVIKNANKYYDKQLLEVFKELACKKSAKPYKSNRHFKDGSWRSMSSWDISQGKAGRYSLDYRFVKEGRFFGGCYDWEDKKRRSTLLQDITTIAHNLGFEGIDSSTLLDNNDWEAGVIREAYFDGGVLFAVKVYKNGNMHLKFHKQLMARLNVEAGRLLGWVTTPKEAEDEMGIKVPKEEWNTQFALELSKVLAIAA